MSKIPNNKNINTFKKTSSIKEQKIMKKPFIEKEKLEKMAQERILQKNVVYVIGLSYKLANKEILQKQEYFGQYGNITKVLTNKTKGLAQNSYYENCYSSYIYYSNPVEASLAILAVDNFKIENHYLKTSFGRTKYCSYFLRNLECLNKDCFYLHKLADKDDIITGDDSKLLFHEQHIQAIKIANLLDANFKKKILSEESKKNCESVFPKASVVFTKPVFLEFQNEFNSSNNNVNNNTLGSNVNGNNGKISLNSIVNGNKSKDDKTKTNDNNTIKENFDKKPSDNDEDQENLDKKNLETESNSNSENAKSNEPVQGLKLADLLRNDKKKKQNSPQKLKLADIINKKSTSDKKIRSNNSNLKNSEINITNQTSNANNENVKNNNNKSIINNKLKDPNTLIDLKIMNSSSKDDKNLKNQESEIINSSDNIEENRNIKSKTKLSEASNFSSEDKAMIESEFNSNSSAATSIKNPNFNLEKEINYINNNLDDCSAKIVSSNLLQEDINKNSINKNLNKEIEKAEYSCVSPQKVNKNSSDNNTPKSKKQITSNNNKNYVKNTDNQENTENYQNKNNNSTANDSKNNILKEKENNSNNNLNSNVNSNAKTSNNNPEHNYFMESGKSDPRSSIISTTSCSVSPNISYNQEIENHLSHTNINNTNSKENCKASELSEKRKSIYTKRDISRFDFVLNNNNINNQNLNKNNNINSDNISSRKSSDNKSNTNKIKEYQKPEEDIPEFVFDVLNKKISRFSFFKRFKNEYDIPDSIFLEDSFIDKNKDESWADFIKMNLNA